MVRVPLAFGSDSKWREVRYCYKIWTAFPHSSSQLFFCAFYRVLKKKKSALVGWSSEKSVESCCSYDQALDLWLGISYPGSLGYASDALHPWSQCNWNHAITQLRAFLLPPGFAFAGAMVPPTVLGNGLQICDALHGNLLVCIATTVYVILLWLATAHGVGFQLILSLKFSTFSWICLCWGGDAFGGSYKSVLLFSEVCSSVLQL